jgi:hypothetical protein
MEQTAPCEANRFVASQEIPRVLLNTESTLLHSQLPATCLYPEPAQSSPHPHSPLPEDPS